MNTSINTLWNACAKSWCSHQYKTDKDIPVVEKALRKLFPLGDGTPRRKYHPMQIRRLLYLVLVKEYSVGLASQMCGVHRSTCARYLRKIRS